MVDGLLPTSVGISTAFAIIVNTAGLLSILLQVPRIIDASSRKMVTDLVLLTSFPPNPGSLSHRVPGLVLPFSPPLSSSPSEKICCDM